VRDQHTNGLELQELGDERPVTALPVGHRLPTRSSLAMADLHSLREFLQCTAPVRLNID
jgi:hypothetical protein